MEIMSLHEWDDKSLSLNGVQGGHINLVVQGGHINIVVHLII